MGIISLGVVVMDASDGTVLSRVIQDTARAKGIATMHRNGRGQEGRYGYTPPNPNVAVKEVFT